MIKLPPIEKVYEAWTAIADGRLSINGENSATVKSSDGSLTYTVEHDPARSVWRSNDNATYWRGYPGYPVLAMMMIEGYLPFDYATARQWEGVNWNALNKAHRRNYAAAVDQVERERGINGNEARSKAEAVMKTLAALPGTVRRLVPQSA